MHVCVFVCVLVCVCVHRYMESTLSLTLSLSHAHTHWLTQLYDLMTTGFKYQIISCKTGQEIVDVTLNHLNSIHRYV